MPIDLLRRAASGIGAAEVREALEAARRAANDRIWVSRNVARLYREVLGDTRAARTVLEEIAPLTCLEWRLTAAAWFELGERAAASRCLERAAANARTGPDLCTIAMGYRDVGYTDEGRLMLEGAATLATRALDRWTLANTHVVFGDRAGALAVLAEAWRDAVEVPEIVVLGHAFATFAAPRAELATMLATGERRASTVRDWLELAIATYQITNDRDAANRCLVAASQLATSADHERAIGRVRARIYDLDLLDDERPRLAPAALLHTGARSFGWDRDPARLLGWLRARLPRGGIEALRRPGESFFNDDLVALLDISKTGLVPHPLPAYLDVLREVRWEEGDDLDHVRRAFACTLLCLEDAALAAPEGSEPTVAILLDSCLALGTGAVDGAMALFAAMADAYDATLATSRMAYLVLFAELGLALAAAWLDPTDPRVDLLIARLRADEPVHRARATRPRSAWLLGLAPHGRRDNLWRSLAARVLIHPRFAELAALLR